jgi:hypothetical protein
MTQEDKELLLKDLCARWMASLKCTPSIKNSIVAYCTVDGINKDIKGGSFIELIDRDSDGNALASTSTNEFDMVKPYLRPMSSMTEEERKELLEIAVALSYNKDDIIIGTQINSFRQLDGVLDLFNSHHLDWRGLIEKGLALEAPDGMYK